MELSKKNRKSKNFSHYPEFIDRKLLNKPLWGRDYRDELEEIDKHEIIVKIAEIIGNCPSNLRKAEEILETIKYAVANYVVNHEYNSLKGVDADFLLWLDSKANPHHAQKLSEFFSKYL